MATNLDVFEAPVCFLQIGRTRIHELKIGEVCITGFKFMKTAVYTDGHFLRECGILVHEAEEQESGEPSFEYSAGHSIMVQSVFREH